MAKAARSAVAAAIGVLSVAGSTGCGGSDSGPASSMPPARPVPSIDLSSLVPPPTSAVAAGRTYQLPPSLCKASDLTALTELYPKVDDKPLADTSGICATGLLSTTTWVNLSIDSELVRNAQLGQAYLDTGRRILKSPTTNLAGVGADAYWTVNGNETKLVSYDGNLVLEISISPGKKQYPLPPDIVRRLGQVANGTFARLAR